MKIVSGIYFLLSLYLPRSIFVGKYIRRGLALKLLSYKPAAAETGRDLGAPGTHCRMQQMTIALALFVIVVLSAG